ncbi:MAG: hypothetical protein HYV63_32555 [Candidatus Schekmanbacteria bacterium]|nr:hypothetical protein [Candidatus Schekmanbacteria bacterium]
MVVKAYALLLWLIPHIDKMPRSRKFTLGDRLENVALELLLTLFEFRVSSFGF